ncbi:DEAD/DEAH box helicase [Mycoplasmopsis alligatoris]|uniref:Type III restriction enzyme, res subunit n=1 Tax=Mycoplasmopsis alligatoris A21JP2 TaxID=747682 RepID=D4XVK1_9BACT|nr:DEAD/DEAH box helicase family protein [Mycoplasmopsis alligatoris]EFF41648.1 type III restriction enzyme, res subunit [Mycoplasmopsis alligatoris A21JP2]
MEQTGTAGNTYHLFHTELAILNNKDNSGNIVTFDDKKIHKILEMSNFKRKIFDNSSATEWFICKLEDVLNAINSAKSNEFKIIEKKISGMPNPIILRKPQREAVEKILKCYHDKYDKFLLDAKMRFGKTISILNAVEKIAPKFTLILTHRPDVETQWKEEFDSCGLGFKNYIFLGKNSKENLEKIVNDNQDKKIVYFASMQDLRGSEIAKGAFNKNQYAFNIPWNLVLIDEAHEGVHSEKGTEVIKALVERNKELKKNDKKFKTKLFFIYLSGTPFNIINDFSPE